MFIIDAEIGDVIKFDGLRWIVLDKVNDGTLCILEDSIGIDTFKGYQWKDSNICRYLNTDFSSKLHVDSIKNNYHDTKVMLLTEAQLNYYKDIIPQLDENWWLMPEADGLRAATTLNEPVKCNAGTRCLIRPVVTFKRFARTEAIFSQPFNEEIIPVTSVMRGIEKDLAHLHKGVQFMVKGERLTALEPTKSGCKCVLHTPYCRLSTEDGFKANWLDAESIKSMGTRMKEFFGDDLLTHRVNLQALDGTFRGNKESDEVYASALDYNTFVKYRDFIPSCSEPWFLGTIYSYNNVQAMYVNPDKTIAVAVKEFLLFPVVVLRYATKVFTCRERCEELWEVNAKKMFLQKQIENLTKQKESLGLDISKLLKELTDLEAKASCLSQGI